MRFGEGRRGRRPPERDCPCYHHDRTEKLLFWWGPELWDRAKDRRYRNELGLSCQHLRVQWTTVGVQFVGFIVQDTPGRPRPGPHLSSSGPKVCPTRTGCDVYGVDVLVWTIEVCVCRHPESEISVGGTRSTRVPFRNSHRSVGPIWVSWVCVRARGGDGPHVKTVERDPREEVSGPRTHSPRPDRFVFVRGSRPTETCLRGGLGFEGGPFPPRRSPPPHSSLSPTVNLSSGHLHLRLF